MPLEKAVKADEVPPGTMVGVKVNGEPVLVANVDGEFFAMDTVCTHQGGPLHEGVLEEATVVCPWHEGAFDVRSGEADPDTAWVTDTRAFRTEVRDGYVWVEV